jgi:hypothetical protein
MTTERQRRAERAVIAHIREPGCNGLVSSFWISANRLRAAAWERLEKRGRIFVEVLPFPYYRVTIRETSGKRKVRKRDK